MSGGGKKATVGYWYKYLQAFALGLGKLDAVLELRAGGRTAWRGIVTESSRIYVNAKNLWGGEKKEGGLQGYMDIQLGDADQVSNDYLTAQLGADQPSYRGKALAVWRGGIWGAMNPYPKRAEFKVRRILVGWDNDAPWYPEKAEIIYAPILDPVPGTWPWVDRGTGVFNIGASHEFEGEYFFFQGWFQGWIDEFRITRGVARYATQEYVTPSSAFGDASSDPFYANVILLLRMLGTDGSTAITEEKGHAVTVINVMLAEIQGAQGGSAAYFNGASSRLAVDMGEDADLGVGPWTIEARIRRETTTVSSNSHSLFGFGLTDLPGNDTRWDINQAGRLVYQQREAPMEEQPAVLQNTGPYVLADEFEFVSICWDGQRYWMHVGGQLVTGNGSQVSMNAAHILYDSITARDMLGEPTALVNDASFRAAADQLFIEGMGLCTAYDFDEDIEEFQQRILDVIGASLTQSREDGQYYLDLIRPTDEPSSLPVITSDDINSLTIETTSIAEQVNELVVEWYDVESNTKRSTPPMQSRGAVHTAGEINSETATYPEVPSEELALKLLARDLAARSTPLCKLTLTTNRCGELWRLRKGNKVRLQAPEDGVADMVVVLGDIDYGTLKDGRLKIKCVQDVYSMPETSYVASQPSQAPPLYSAPEPPPALRLIEAPFVEVSANLSAADLAAFPEDAGAIVAMASRPSTGLNYGLYTAPEGGELDDLGTGEWCPTAMIVESAGRLEEDFTLAAAFGLEFVEVGSWALWGDEIVRVDAIDSDALTISLGRGCADTVRARHAAGGRIWFCGDWGSTDGQQYLDGETVNAKLLTRTTIEEQPSDVAVLLTVEMQQRQFRPYPPAGLTINSDADLADDALLVGDVVLAWAHRDRVLQSDQLIDSATASIGPEPGTTVVVENYDDQTDTLTHSQSGLTGTVATLPAAELAANNRLEVYSVRDGLISLQRHVFHFRTGFTITGYIGNGANYESYSALLEVDGGVAPISWAIIAGSLPVGLHLDSSGQIQGVPNDSVGYYEATVWARDVNGAWATRDIEIGIGTVVSLSHMDGAVPGSTFTDEASKVWATSGAVARSNDGWDEQSASFSGGILATGASADLTFGTGDYTMECRIKLSALPGAEKWFLSNRYIGGGTPERAASALSIQSNNKVAFSNGSAWLDSGLTPPVGTFAHVQMTRRNGQVYQSIEGVLGTVHPFTLNMTSIRGAYIGGVDTSFSGARFGGLIDEVRITRGVGLYTEDHPVPARSDYPQPAGPLSVNGSLPAGADATPYSSTADIAIHGLATPYSVSVVDGSLPAGWSAAVSGSNVSVDGPGVAAGDYAFTLRVADDDSNTADLPLVVRVL